METARLSREFKFNNRKTRTVAEGGTKVHRARRAGPRALAAPQERLQVRWQACPQGESLPVNHTQRRRTQRSPGTSLR